MGKKYIDAEPIIIALRIMAKEHKEKAHGDPFEAAYAGTIAGIANAMDKLPAADVTEVVRCKDCKHYNDGFECLIEGYGIERDKEWYCGDAERREE